MPWRQRHYRTTEADLIQDRIPVGYVQPAYQLYVLLELMEGESLNEQFWKGHQWLPPDVTCRGRWDQGQRDVWWSDVRGGGLYSEVQFIMGNGHMGLPLWTDRHEWKHYLLAILLADGNKVDTLLFLKESQTKKSNKKHK